MPRLVIPTDEEIQAFFFEAMLHGWVSKNPTDKIKISENETVFTFSDGKLFLWDRYWTSPGTDFSAGVTLIRSTATKIPSEGIPVWIMQYQGAYDREAIPFLKKVLLTAYQNRLFFGGRGSPFVKSGRLMYKNDATGDFGRFSGNEEIITENGVRFGWHDYMGMSLT